jgi:hypothetical protein
MSIETHFEALIKNLEAEKEREVAAIKEKAMREKVVPYNREMDIARDKAIAEKQEALNQAIATQQEIFAKERQKIVEAAEKKKADNMNTVLATETYTVTGVYDKEISFLKERLANLKSK